jgi:Flp pilus assembly protein TadD
MKFKSIFSIISLSPLVLILMIAFSAPLAAQDTPYEPKPLDKMVSKKTTRAQDDSDKSGPTIVPTISNNPASKRSVADKKIAPPIHDPAYWFDKGALCATYGNDHAAIKYFQKTISLDPSRSGAYFELGISYGQLGEFDKAILLINKALEMEPQNGLYLYGRGRVHLLAGETENATVDFKKAAALEDEDAQNYLEMIAKTRSDEDSSFRSQME